MEQFFATVNSILVAIDDFIWGVPLMVLILFGGHSADRALARPSVF